MARENRRRANLSGAGRIAGGQKSPRGAHGSTYVAPPPPAPPPPEPVIQTVTVTAGGGTFTLTFNSVTTAALDFDATGAEVEAALGLVGVTVEGDGPYVVTFDGDYAGTEEVLTADGSSLTLNEKQTISVTATSGTYTITGSAGQSAGIAPDAIASDVRAAIGTAVTEGVTAIQMNSGAPDYEIEYVGALADTDVAILTLGVGSLVGGTATIEETVKGGTASVTVT